MMQAAASAVNQTSNSPSSAIATAVSLAIAIAILVVSIGGCWAVRSRFLGAACLPKGQGWATPSRSREMACPPNSMDEACRDVADVIVIDPPACPRCAEPMTWSWYNRGSYGSGWHCEHFAACGTSAANCGAHRWHCSACRKDICDACRSEPARGSGGEPERRARAAAALGQPRKPQDVPGHPDPEATGAAADFDTMSVADEKHVQVRSVSAMGAGAIRRKRRESSGILLEGQGHGRVQSISAPGAGALPPGRESGGRGEGEGHGQIWSVLTLGAGALLRLMRESSGRGEEVWVRPDEQHGQVQSILAPPVPWPAVHFDAVSSTERRLFAV